MEACICGNPIIQPSTGRRASYCSNRCRLRAWRTLCRETKGETKLNTQSEAIRLYCGVCSVSYNCHPVACGPYACVSPVYGHDDRKKNGDRRNAVFVPPDTLIIQDSGAYSDGPLHRLSYADALQRQIAHARYYKYGHQVTHRASYDLLIDETWKNHFRHKERWTEEAGKFAVKATVEAAQFLDQHRALNIGCIMSAQGVTPSQYLDCAEQVLKYVDVDRDIFGLGGWCILGKQPSFLPVFRETMQHVLPLLAQYHVQRVHVWGVCFAEPLGELLYLCDRHQMSLSTDSIGPALKPELAEWGYASWYDPTYRRPSTLPSCKAKNASGYNSPSCEPETRCMGLERAKHVALTRDWLAHFRERESNLYHAPKLPVYRQLPWMEEDGNG